MSPFQWLKITLIFVIRERCQKYTYRKDNWSVESKNEVSLKDYKSLIPVLPLWFIRLSQQMVQLLGQLSRADIYHTCTKSSRPGVDHECLIIHDLKMLNNKNSFTLQIITPLETCNILSFPNIVIWFLTSCNSLSTLIASISKTRSHNAICHRLILSWAIEEKVNWDTVTG